MFNSIGQPTVFPLYEYTNLDQLGIDLSDLYFDKKDEDIPNIFLLSSGDQ